MKAIVFHKILFKVRKNNKHNKNAILENYNLLF